MNDNNSVYYFILPNQIVRFEDIISGSIGIQRILVNSVLFQSWNTTKNNNLKLFV